MTLWKSNQMALIFYHKEHRAQTVIVSAQWKLGVTVQFTSMNNYHLYIRLYHFLPLLKTVKSNSVLRLIIVLVHPPPPKRIFSLSFFIPSCCFKCFFPQWNTQKMFCPIAVYNALIWQATKNSNNKKVIYIANTWYSKSSNTMMKY